MISKSVIVDFLRRDINISRINFSFGRYKVYPTAYQKDVADAIDSGEIVIGTAVSKGAGATYILNFDSLELSHGFSLSTSEEKGLLVHECTHAHLDIQNFGSHSGHENEAVAYVAEAVFLEAAGYPPISTHPIRVISHGIAKKLLAGAYSVGAADSATLVAAVAAEPQYSSKALYMSDGFNRSIVSKVVRHL